MTPKIDVVDLSHWNTVTDWNAVKAAGVVGVIHKATEGTGFVDKDYAPRVEPAMSAGLQWGAYHFLQPGSDQEIDAQISHFVKVVKPWTGMRLAIDYEASGLTLPHLRRACSSLLARASEPQIAIYGGSLLKAQLGNSMDEYLATFALWLAHYSPSPSWPKETWPVPSLWQYSDGTNGPKPKTVPGINSPCDCNAFNGSSENCAKWFGPPQVKPAPEVEREPDMVVVRSGSAIRIKQVIDTSLDADEMVIESAGCKVWVEA